MAGGGGVLDQLLCSASRLALPVDHLAASPAARSVGVHAVVPFVQCNACKKGAGVTAFWREEAAGCVRTARLTAAD